MLTVWGIWMICYLEGYEMSRHTSFVVPVLWRDPSQHVVWCHGSARCKCRSEIQWLLHHSTEPCEQAPPRWSPDPPVLQCCPTLQCWTDWKHTTMRNIQTVVLIIFIYTLKTHRSSFSLKLFLYLWIMLPPKCANVFWWSMLSLIETYYNFPNIEEPDQGFLLGLLWRLLHTCWRLQ